MGIIKKILKESSFKRNNIASLFLKIKDIENSYETSLDSFFVSYFKVHKKLEQIEQELNEKFSKVTKLGIDFSLVNDEENYCFKQIELEIDFIFESSDLKEQDLDDLFQGLFGKTYINGVLDKNVYKLYLLIK